MNSDLVARLLRRADKYQLGGASALQYAPRRPLFLDVPGLWDGAHYRHVPLGRGYALAILTEPEPGKTLPLRRRSTSWTPGTLVRRFTSDWLTLEEQDRLAPDPEPALLSEFRLTNRGNERCRGALVLWTAVPVAANCLARPEGDGLVWQRTAEAHDGARLELWQRLALDGAAGSALQLSQGSLEAPDWERSPFAGRPWTDWSGEVSASGLYGGLLYAALARPFDLGPGERMVATGGMLVGPVDRLPADGAKRPAQNVPGEDAKEEIGEEGAGASRVAFSLVPLFARAVRGWAGFWRGVPALACDDPFVEAAWAYRWYCLYQMRLQGDGLWATCEGPDVFHRPISYSAPAQLRDLRWHRDPAAADGCWQLFAGRQRPDGEIPGHLGLRPEDDAAFYHADWGGALLALLAVRPDAGRTAEIARFLVRYAGYLERARDPEGSGLITIIDQQETGQEYSSRYQAVDPQADALDWQNRIRLKGIDASVYAYRVYQALARLAAEWGDAEAARRWRERAERCGSAVLDRLWDAEDGWFTDLDPATGRRTGVRAAVGLYPFLTDLVDERHLVAIRRHLLAPDGFWTPWPVPTLDPRDPAYDARGRWKGQRMNCPWNGRVWLMANSHAVDALARAARLDPSLRPAAGHLLRRTIELLFLDGDPRRPACYEHYDPELGTPCLFRGIDDYVHSWIADLIVRHAVGLSVGWRGELRLDPLPLGLRRVALRGLVVRGHEVDLSWEQREQERVVTIRVDGKRRQYRAQDGERLAVPL